MSDIDYVREGFARGWQGDGSVVDMDEAFADNEREFDRWLAQHDAEVAKAAKAEALREEAQSPRWRHEEYRSFRMGLLASANRIEAGEGA